MVEISAQGRGLWTGAGIGTGVGTEALKQSMIPTVLPLRPGDSFFSLSLLPESLVRWRPNPLRSSISAAFVRRLKMGSACAMIDSEDEKPFCKVRDLGMKAI